MHQTARPPLARMVRIDRALRSESWPNASTLARELEVHRRTIQRDIIYLRDQLGAPIEFDSRKHGYFYSEPSYRLAMVQLSERELVALFLAEQLLLHYRGTPFAADISRAFAKITAGLDDQITVDARRLSEAISFRSAPAAVFDLKMLETLIHAIVHRRRVVMDYWTASRDDQNRREVDPYHLLTSDGQHYLIGHCHWRNGIRHFVPARIRSIEVSEITFDVPETFRVDEYLSSAMVVFRSDEESTHRIKLRFTGLAVRYILERKVHESQVVEMTPDGDAIVTIVVSHFREVERLVLGWLPYCEALEPPELRAAVARAVTEGARNYTAKS